MAKDIALFANFKARLFVESLEERALLAGLGQPIPVDPCSLEARAPIHDLTNEHTDLDVNYANGCLSLNENNKSVDPIDYYSPAQTILEFLPGAERPQTSDPRFSFIGAGAGNPVWIVPISPRDPNLLQLGVSGERIDTDVMMSYRETDHRINNVIPFPWIKLNVVDVRGPGYFSGWQNDDFGNPTIWVATSPGGNPDPNLFFTAPGGHIDYNWAFTAPGNYQVDIRASAFLADGTRIQSLVRTYHFQVDPTGGAPGRQSHQELFTDLPGQFAAGTLKDLGQQSGQTFYFTPLIDQNVAVPQPVHGMSPIAAIVGAFASAREESLPSSAGFVQQPFMGRVIGGDSTICAPSVMQPLDLQPI